jgi:hypothetical protein
VERSMGMRASPIDLRCTRELRAQSSTPVSTMVAGLGRIKLELDRNGSRESERERECSRAR